MRPTPHPPLYPGGTTLNTPSPQSLGNGIHLVPLPLPFRSPQSVNTYVIEADDGLVLIDCGADWDPGRDALTEGFAALDLDLKTVSNLIVTHLHPDHVGMSKRLVGELGCRLVMHRSAVALAAEYNDTPGYYNRLRSIAQSHGVPDAIVEAVAATPRPEYMPTIDPPDRPMDDGDHLTLNEGRHLEVIHTPGHDRSHICIRDSKTGIIFSGDHVLPRISPVIMHDFDGADALGDYISSLRKLIDRGISTTYPAHGDIVERGDERVRQILLHHDRRLLDMATLVGEGVKTAWEVMLKSFRPNLDPLQARLAFLETVAHLQHLELTGRIVAETRGERIFYSPR